ncbi:hypothetical protein M408DRAFT_307790 [Serendipita vermifera MAFF 305830]|uniref:SGNH hydrolase-type esterase domain-containing protein n=1 Tax=Serendipita vermifera MAFF 305830 TaxID=933852 RepID=A0A0C3B8P8_SERVB|nr:hypothetical protein M408DRAFT_307790 [Serendipita vermifera MAFF 305830]
MRSGQYINLSLVVFTLLGLVSTANVINPGNPLIWYHGRWDWGRETWWSSTGFTLNVENLSSLSLQLGPNTTQPFVSVGISVNYGEFTQFNLTSGTAGNVIPLSVSTSQASGRKTRSVIRLMVQGWENNNLQLEKIILNSGSSLLSYQPSPLNFLFIGDSFGAGQYISNGINGAWPSITAETFKAEQQDNAIPGICLADYHCWGNTHGLSYIFFKTEDSLYYYNPKHNYTTNWDFRRDYRPTHIFINGGINDNYYNITGASLTTAYSGFIDKLRALYPTQPIFLIGSSQPNGPINETGTYSYYANGINETVTARHAKGDKKVYFIDTAGWIRFSDMISLENAHFNPSGHTRFAEQLGGWLKSWGLQPQNAWPTRFT